MRLVTGGTTFHFDRRVFEDEGSAFVAVTLEAPGLIGIHGADHRALQDAAVRIMAIDA